MGNNGKRPPGSNDAPEREAIGLALHCSPGLLTAHGLRHSHFAHPRDVVFHAICTAAGEVANGIPVPSRVMQLITYTSESELSLLDASIALQELVRAVGLPDHAEWYAKEIIQAWSQREIAGRVAQMMGAVDQGDWDKVESIRIEMGKVMDQSAARSADNVAVSLMSLQAPAQGAPDELIKTRFLCRGKGCLLVGPSGIGKSSFGMQLGICLSIGRPLFGIQPAKAMKILLIQAENDDGDLAEMRDGVLAGMGLTAEEIAAVGANFFVKHHSGRCGKDFFDKVVLPSLDRHKPDILMIDPGFSYIDGDVKDSTDVGAFLRKQLDPLIVRAGCGSIIIHHTNKPPSPSKEKSEWEDAVFAYLGAGSAEWTNWHRAILNIRQLEGGIFELRGAKRGIRLGWVEEDGETKAIKKYIRHSPLHGVICWEECSGDDVPKTAGKGEKNQPLLPSPEEILRVLEEAGSEMSAHENNMDGLSFKLRAVFNLSRDRAKISLSRAIGNTIKVIHRVREGYKGGSPSAYYVPKNHKNE